MDNSITWVFTHDNTNDTHVTYEPFDGQSDFNRSELRITFDPFDGYPPEELIYAGEDATATELIHELLEEIQEANDNPNHDPYYDRYSLPTMFAFENALRYLDERIGK